jgi:hypothetical protein
LSIRGLVDAVLKTELLKTVPSHVKQDALVLIHKENFGQMGKEEDIANGLQRKMKVGF